MNLKIVTAVGVLLAGAVFLVAALTVLDGPDASSGAVPGAETAAATPVHATTPVPVAHKHLISAARIAAARKYARSRGGNAAFAVIDEPGGRPRGYHRYASYPSASVSKAMMMVDVLRRAKGRPLGGGEKALLKPMITVSDNNAASAVYRKIGAGGVKAVARAAHMQRFHEAGFWANERLTPADQARLFYKIDRLVPARHRRYARYLLSSIIPAQRWGIARAAKRRGYKIFFKGGWRTNINHQIALLEKNGHRFSLAVMTNQNGVRGQRTEEGIALKILR